jgi:hypothetical protein
VKTESPAGNALVRSYILWGMLLWHHQLDCSHSPAGIRKRRLQPMTSQSHVWPGITPYQCVKWTSSFHCRIGNSSIFTFVNVIKCPFKLLESSEVCGKINKGNLQKHDILSSLCQVYFGYVVSSKDSVWRGLAVNSNRDEWGVSQNFPYCSLRFRHPWIKQMITEERLKETNLPIWNPTS